MQQISVYFLYWNLIKFIDKSSDFLVASVSFYLSDSATCK